MTGLHAPARLIRGRAAMGGAIIAGGLVLALLALGALLATSLHHRARPRPVAHPAWLSEPLRPERALAKLEMPEDQP